jgi:hypothetical protein
MARLNSKCDQIFDGKCSLLCFLTFSCLCLLAFLSVFAYPSLHNPSAPQPHLSFFSMPLQKIYWNDVYCHKPHRRALAELHIVVHYLRKDYLSKANYAILLFVLIPTWTPFTDDIFRENSWNGERGEANSSWASHLTIRFWTAPRVYCVTEHINMCDEAYLSHGA